jgi:hypothetical protein
MKGRFNPVDRGLSDEEIIALFSDPAEIPERFSMALMFDEGVNQDAIIPLLNRCPRLNITTTQDQALTGEKSDFRILSHARGIACTLVAEDKIYETHHQRVQNLALSHAGIIYVPETVDPERLIEFVVERYERSIEKDAPNLLHNWFWRA